MRRLDVEDVLGHVPMPDIEAGMYLIDLLFKVGPVRGEMPLVESDLEPWERRRGVELAPWQADTVLDMSQAYLRQMHVAREPSALSPWPKARNMWKYVCDKKHEQKQAEQKEKEPHGSHKRHRNPSPR